MNEKNNNNNSTLSISIEVNSPCVKCNGDCDNCPHYIDEVDYTSIKNEAEAFRLSLNINMRKHNELTINI